MKSLDFLKPKETKSRRRVHVLNAVLMRYITDFMASNDLIPDFLGRGIEITKVKVNQDYTCVNVYWLTTKTSESEEIERLLHKNAGKLKSLLCKHNVVGNMPHIFFVKDKYQQHIADVEALLAIADFGDDFQPTDPAHHVKSTIILRQSLSRIPNLEEIDDKETTTTKCDNESTAQNEEDKDLLSIWTADPSFENVEMRRDILGVNHKVLMLQVARGMAQAKAVHRFTPPLDANEPLEAVGDLSNKPVDEPAKKQHLFSNITKKMELKEYLEHRKKLHYALKKQLKAAKQLETVCIPTTDTNINELQYEESDIDLDDEDVIEEINDYHNKS